MALALSGSKCQFTVKVDNKSLTTPVFAMSQENVIPPPETIKVPADTDEICCDGGGGALGHPVVWYTFGDAGKVECAYCDRLFVRA